jgi:Ca-activated chloride channel family protein
MNRIKIIVVAAALVAALATFHGLVLKVPFLVQLPAPAASDGSAQPAVETSRVQAIIPVPPRPPAVRARPPLDESGPDGVIRFQVRPAAGAVLAGGPAEAWVLVTLEADRIRTSQRMPLNVALVIDRSGSMAARNKLEYAKAAARHVVRQLSAADRVSVVAFDSVSTVLVPSTPARDVDAICAALDGLTPGGSTNLSQGMSDGVAEVVRHLRRDQVNRVLLMTDGLANFGETSPDGLARLARGAAGSGVAITTLGLGADFSEDTLLSIAEHAGGRYYYIESPDQMSAIYAGEIRGLHAVVARDVQLDLTPASGVSIETVYGYRGAGTPGRDPIAIGDLSSGQSRKVTLRMRVPPLARPGPEHPLVTVRLTYRDAQTGRSVVSTKQAVVAVVATAAEADGSIDRNVEAKVESVRAAAKLEEAMNHLDRGDRASAQAALIGQIRASRAANARRIGSASLELQVVEMEKQLQRLNGVEARTDASRDLIKGAKSRAYTLTW